MGHLKYISILAIVGIIFAIMFTAAEKLIIENIKDKKKRRYIKVAIYALLYFIGACIIGEIMDWARD